jgi:hypothetical protein
MLLEEKLKSTHHILFDNIPRILEEDPMNPSGPGAFALFAWLISHQPAVFFSHNKPATSNEPTLLFSQNKPSPATSQPNRLFVCCNVLDHNVHSPP